ncbi:metal ABC transporter ATP-binding protein [Canibacter zhoujuaniae]|uniref:metal ABC transporter ATP-binding protein n=1 Tax=Canibacter zhoujuaniae TaxID=2708343 RepID=UPI001422EB80|nr:metal ABC transporter ATP-binding protein [Canibacter zhoujuaniae]
MSTAPLTIENLSVSYGSNHALQKANLTVPAGSMTGVLGPNGAGKSTLLKAALGLQKPSRGRALFFGAPLRRAPWRVGYVPQLKSVDWDFPATAKDVVEMGTFGVPHLKKRADRAAALEDALWRTAIGKIQDKPIGKLSGGQRQRVFVARALVAKPELLLLDEPFTGVDAPSERFIMRALREFQESGTTVLIVHHDLHTAPKYFSHVALMNKTVQHFGPTAEILTPANIAETFEIPFSAELAAGVSTATGAIRIIASGDTNILNHDDAH